MSFDAPEDPWGDSISKNQTASVLFDPADNPYADHLDIFKKDQEETGEEEEEEEEEEATNEAEPAALEDVDFNSDPFRDEHHRAYNDLNSTLNKMNLSPPQLESTHSETYDDNLDDVQAPLKVAFDETPQVIEPTKEEIEEMKAKKQTLLSNLTNIADEEDSPFGSSVLSAPLSSNDVLFSGSQRESDPLSDVLKSVSMTETESPSDRTVTSSVISPNKKTTMFKRTRARRAPRGLANGAGVAAGIVESTEATSGSNLDPLSAKSKQDEESTDGNEDDTDNATKLRNDLVKSAEGPLFKLDKSSIPKLDASPKRPFSPSVAATSSNSIKSTGTNNSTITSASASTSMLSPKKPEPNTPLDAFEIVVGDPMKVGELTNAHIVYTITTRTKSNLMKQEETTVTRRYRDFLWLYSQLMNNHAGYIIPPPPEKQIYGRFDDKFIENRRLSLEKMLLKISKIDVLHNDYDFILFLASENFSVEAKEREFIHYHGEDGSTFKPDDMSQSIDYSSSSLVNKSASSSASSSSGTGFFSSLTDAFSMNTPKFVETDQYFIDTPTYIENLDSQLKSISKTLDLILGQREEVINSLEELINTIKNFVELEINNDLSNIFGHFEELQTKVKELLERTNMQQILTIGSCVDEYTRTIGSIRNIFETRFKLCNNIINLQSQSSKKQKNLMKFKNKFHNQTEKIEKYEQEIEKLENQISSETQHKDEVTQIIKDQLNKFEYEKIDDFRSMVEIYWEGLCETQKELIELWESFYDQCHFDDE